MKKRILPLLTATTFVISSSALALGAGVIVHDAKQSIDTAAQWVKEGTQWTKELTAYKDELYAKTGIRDVQGMIQDAQSMSSDLNQIYNQGESFYSDYIKNPEGALSAHAKSIMDKYQVSETCVNKGYTGDAVKGCEAKFISDLATIEYGNELQTKISNDNNEMASLISQVKNSQDPKQTADAANAIQLANLKFEKLKFQYEMYRDKQQNMAAYNREMNDANFRKQQMEAKELDWSQLKNYMN